jgi:rhodanese-related sulfurtransferase
MNQITKSVVKITRDELHTKIRRGDNFVLAEALPEMYYRKAHLPGAINLPHDQVTELAPTLLRDKNVEVVVYCANTSCRNSDIAAQRLAQLGYTRVREYMEGKQDWMDAGLPVESTLDEAVNS